MLNSRRHKEKAQEGHRIINQNLNVGSNDVSILRKIHGILELLFFLAYYIVIKPDFLIKNIIIFFFKKTD
jgi:hypothetical protein